MDSRSFIRRIGSIIHYHIHRSDINWYSIVSPKELAKVSRTCHICSIPTTVKIRYTDIYSSIFFFQFEFHLISDGSILIATKVPKT